MKRIQIFLAVAMPLIAIGIVSSVMLYQSGVIGVSGVVSSYPSQGQSQWISFDRIIEGYPIVIIGTVENIEETQLDQSKTIAPAWMENETIVKGEPYILEDIRPYQKITIQVDEYLKDSTQSFQNQLEFYAEGKGVGQYKGERVLYESMSNPHILGEKALFLIKVTEHGMFSNDYNEKFSIDEMGFAVNDYLTYKIKNYEPKHLDELKIEIKEIASVQKEVNDYLDSTDGVEVLNDLKTEFENKEIPINDKAIRSIVYSDLKNKANQELPLAADVQQIKDVVNEDWAKSRDNPSSENFRYANVDESSSTSTNSIILED